MEDSAEGAAARREQAGRRAEELRARRGRLERGEVVTEQDVADAKDAVERAQQRNVESSRAAAKGGRSAAEAHRKAAEMLRRAGDEQLAVWHLEQAGVDDAAAVAKDTTSAPESES